MYFEKFEKHSHFFENQISGESVSKPDTDQGNEERGMWE